MTTETINEKLKRLLRDALLDWKQSRDKAAALRSMLQNLEEVGYYDQLQAAFEEGVTEILANEDGDEEGLLERILSKTLIDEVGYERTEVDQPSLNGAPNLTAPSLPE